MFIVLMSSSSFLARVAKVSDRTKCLSVNNESCMIWPTLIDSNPVELKYYSFSLDKCIGSLTSGCQKYMFLSRNLYSLLYIIFSIILSILDNKEIGLIEQNVYL